MGGSKILGLSWLKERVLTKMQGWKGSILNQAGKEILIKVVVQAIPSYVMYILYLPKTLCSSLTASVAKFWWASSGKDRGIHWKNIKILCSPKHMGGLGFKDFNSMNSALLSKQAWCILQDPNSYWPLLPQRYLLPKSRFLAC